MTRVMAWASIVVLALTGFGANRAAASGPTIGDARSAGARVPGGGELLFTRTAFPDVQTVYATSGRQEHRITSPGASCCLVRVSPNHAASW